MTIGMAESAVKLELVVPSEINGPTIPLKWCVTEETLTHLKQKGVKEPFILISVGRVERVVDFSCYIEDKRYLVPLGQMLQYIEFPRPGKNFVAATIVWDDMDGGDGPLESFLRKKDGRYATDVVRPNSGVMYYGCGYINIQVEVPAEVFAPEPPAWEKRWVNRLWETSAADQCHYRQRRLIAYSIQPIIVLVFLLYDAIKAVAMLIAGGVVILASLLAAGIRRLDWRDKEKQAAEREARRRAEEERQRRELEELYASLQKHLLCIRARVPGGIATLPPARQTLRLKFQAFKARVCLPFAR